MVARRIRRIELFRAVHGAVGHEGLHAISIGDGNGLDFQVHIALDFLCLNDFPADGAMLAMIVVGAEETVHEHPPLECVCIGAVLEEFADVPVQAFDGDASVRPNLKLPAVRVVCRVDDDMRVADGGNRAVARLDVAREPVVEVTPTAAGLLVFLHVVRGGILEGVDFLDGFRFVQPLAQRVGIPIQPIREPRVLDVDGTGLDRVLKAFTVGWFMMK